ncbi:Phosphate uptake regulator [Halanaeroarchaeum sp. HSR-CO]|uniref:phosphate uptake regulator PhoU n=1 Tax=Halanaeroarchaeum sp. HSR-CO TaxID=2866382 RepID=UPI00217DDC8E|nr:phosphate uptake regulator PhoU [Halanaeroarchaeum sp. HSR-CO]UWG46351.1 Phosphate uptake regulator [Halanaeroarchaeum sp. HSR-CO]
METRKAQLTGGSTFTVSLPKQWATDIDLETGDTIRLFPRDRTLIIQPAEDVTDRWAIEVDVGDRSPAEIQRTVQALYTTGFNSMTLSSARGIGEEARTIRAVARKFIGLETIESTDQTVTLQSLLDSATVSVEQSTVQLTQVALAMHADAIEALLHGDDELADLVAERDDQVDRLYAMITRHFQRSLVDLQETEELSLDQSTLYDYQTTARQLERVGDHAEKIAGLGRRFETPPDPAFAEPIREHSASARNIVERAVNTVFGNAGIDAAHDALEERDEVTDSLEALGRSLHDRDVPESHLLAPTIDSVTRTAEYGANIAETALQAAAREKTL